MTTRRLQHVSVQTPPALLDRCAAFYTDVLGMRRIPNRAGLAWFEFGDGDHVHLLDGPGGADSDAHLALVVSDLDDTLARARAAGAAPRRGADLWGVPRWFVRDPAGNLIEVFETPPAPT